MSLILSLNSLAKASKNLKSNSRNQLILALHLGYRTRVKCKETYFPYTFGSLWSVCEIGPTMSTVDFFVFFFFSWSSICFWCCTFLFFIFCSPFWRNTSRDYDICRYVQYNLICFKYFRFLPGQSSFLGWPAWFDRQRPTALASCIWTRLCLSSLRVIYMHSILVQCPDWFLEKFLVERDLSVSVPYWLLSLASIQPFFPIRPHVFSNSPKVLHLHPIQWKSH